MPKALNNITIDSGNIELTINNDPERLIVFNPEDMIFVERFYLLSEKLNEYKKEMSKLLESDEADENGIPLNSRDRIQLLSQVSQYVRAQVNDLFGENAAEHVFGKKTTSLDAFSQFISGVTPFVKGKRQEKAKKYQAKKVSSKTSAKTKAGA